METWEYTNRPYWIDGIRYEAPGWAIMQGTYCVAVVEKESTAKALIEAHNKVIEQKYGADNEPGTTR